MWSLLSERRQRFGNFSERRQIMITVIDHLPSTSRVAHPWHLGRGAVLRVFSSIPGLYLLNTHSTQP